MNFNYCNLHGHNTESLLDGFGSAKKVCEHVEKIGMNAFAITNHHVLSGVVALEKETKKRGQKLLRGIELYICKDDSTIKTKENAALTHLCVIAKNKDGWKDLLNIVAFSNSPDRFYHKPRLSIDELRQFASNGNLISYAGHPGSVSCSKIFTDHKAAYRCRTEEDARSFLDPDWEKILEREMYEMQDVFGKGQWFAEIQLIDRENFKAAQVIADCFRHVAHKIKIPCLSTADSHYQSRESAQDQRILLCSALKTTFNKVNAALEANEDVGLGAFFRSNNFHIPDHSEMVEIHKGFEEEVANTQLIADMCEDYSLAHLPRIPKFDCPDGLTSQEYFAQICREGWKEKIIPILKEKPELKQVYGDRIKYELDMIHQGKLEDYFLIVSDYLNYTRSKGSWVGRGRGSAGGCLASFLSGIIGLDPIEHNLYFERFINMSRILSGDIADIDSDIEVHQRPDTIEYLKRKYGRDRVSGICNFGRMMGRSALKEVLRVFDACSFDESNAITDYVPDEASVSDALQEMIEAGEDASIIKWALKNEAKGLSQWCRLTDDEQFEGPFARYFEAAFRIEGNKKSVGSHASGYVIGPEPLKDIAPMIYNKSSPDPILGMDHNDLAYMGLVKYDLLALVGQTVMREVSETLAMDSSYAA